MPVNRRKEEEKEIFRMVIRETRKLYFDRFSENKFDLESYDFRIQKIINDYYSLIGYGTAAEPADGGEDWALLKAFARSGKLDSDFVVFDVGAHWGEYLELCQAIIPFGKYHCFEPTGKSFSKLKALVEDQKWDNVSLNKMAISDKRNRKTPMYVHIEGAAQASLTDIDLEHRDVKFDYVEKVVTDTLENYCSEKKIKEIDLLKIDTEGWEYKIIESIMPMINRGQIKAIQFEFGVCHLDTRNYFKDFWKLLKDRYDFYRVHPYGLIKISNYREEYEVFQVVNYYLELNEKR